MDEKLYEQLSELFKNLDGKKSTEEKLEAYNDFVKLKGDDLHLFIKEKIEILNSTVEENKKLSPEDATLNNNYIFASISKQLAEKSLEQSSLHISNSVGEISLKESLNGLSFSASDKSDEQKIKDMELYVLARSVEYNLNSTGYSKGPEGPYGTEFLTPEETSSLAQTAKNYGLEMIKHDDISPENNDKVSFKDLKTGKILAEFAVKLGREKH